jgi:hypothetical protein
VNASGTDLSSTQAEVWLGKISQKLQTPEVANKADPRPIPRMTRIKDAEQSAVNAGINAVESALEEVDEIRKGRADRKREDIRGPALRNAVQALVNVVERIPPNKTRSSTHEINPFYIDEMNALIERIGNLHSELPKHRKHLADQIFSDGLLQT